jgi:hypothetical protein
MFLLSLFYIFGLTFIFNPILSTNSDSIVIENGFVTCYSDRLVIHFYYFPFGDKTIQYNNINSCELLRNEDLSLFKTKSWGMAFSFVWWPLDIHRLWREYYIIIDANQWLKIGLTMNDNDTLKVYQLIKQKMILTSLENEI